MKISFQFPVAVCLTAVSAMCLLVPATMAGTGTTTRVSVSSSGAQANDSSWGPSISADGRFVAFQSGATNLVAGDTNGKWDIFEHDRSTATTARVSVSSSGAQANDKSHRPSISGDGRFVAFESVASNLVRGDANGRRDIFVHDRRAGTTTRVSTSSTGTEANSASVGPAISADGRFVAFTSYASNLVPDDTNGQPDVFVRDLRTQMTTRVSVSASGAEGNNKSHRASISADGRFVAFSSGATNLVPTDTNGLEDIFVRDRTVGRTTRVSVRSGGAQTNGTSHRPSISADGRFVAFQSYASNLVGGDTNGQRDIFVHDRGTGGNTLVSVSSTGAQANGPSLGPSISADGRFVVYTSYASSLVSHDTNEERDIFRSDLSTGTTTRVSVSSTAAQANGASFRVSISANGRFVAFRSYASNLVSGDTNGRQDVFVRHP